MEKEPPKQRCQCNLLYIRGQKEAGLPPSYCKHMADPSTGEAMLCLPCWEHPDHQQANMVPKLLPKRSLTLREG